MNINVFPSIVKGEIQAPASKSMLQRAIVAAFLADEKVQIEGFSSSADVLAALELVKALGADFRIKESTLVIEPNFESKTRALSIGESGLGMRLFSPLLALYDQEFLLQADGTLQKRPLHLIEKVLSQQGVKCSSSNGYAPLRICGPLQGGDFEMDASEGSQLLSGLLMTLPKLKKDSVIRVKHLKSKPYIDMTISLLKAFGIIIENENYSRFIIGGNQKYKANRYGVEGDWSGAAFLLVAAAINGSIQLNNLRMDSLQGDKNIVDVLHQVGAIIIQEENSIYVEKTKLTAFDYDATETPDLFPPLAALAASCKGVSRIKGVHRLIHKESNRAAAIQTIFDQLGLNLRIEGDEMLIASGDCQGGQISSFNDHRMAMMGTVLALNAKNAVQITEAESIRKSYPNFYADMIRIGVNINEV